MPQGVQVQVLSLALHNLGSRVKILGSFMVSLGRNGRLAQLVEHSAYIRKVIGSSPIPTTLLKFLPKTSLPA